MHSARHRGRLAPGTPHPDVSQLIEIDAFGVASPLGSQAPTRPVEQGIAHDLRRYSEEVALGLILALVLALAAVLARVFLGNPSPPQPVTRVTVLLPENTRVLSMAVSPDGRTIGLVLVKDGRQQIWVPALDTLELKLLPGTDGATNPFWSPDSRYIAFFADARLKKIDRSGGPVQIATATSCLARLAKC
jgi:WD40-like Beta Propeller Repeat